MPHRTPPQPRAPSALPPPRAAVTLPAAGIVVGAEAPDVAVPPRDEAQPVRRLGADPVDGAAWADGRAACGMTPVALESTGVEGSPRCARVETRGCEGLWGDPPQGPTITGRPTRAVPDGQWRAAPRGAVAPAVARAERSHPQSGACARPSAAPRWPGAAPRWPGAAPGRGSRGVTAPPWRGWTRPRRGRSAASSGGTGGGGRPCRMSPPGVGAVRPTGSPAARGERAARRRVPTAWRPRGAWRRRACSAARGPWGRAAAGCTPAAAHRRR
jgi:hypothetical protein